jgi:hypothetical protein
MPSLWRFLLQNKSNLESGIQEKRERKKKAETMDTSPPGVSRMMQAAEKQQQKEAKEV